GDAGGVASARRLARPARARDRRRAARPRARRPRGDHPRHPRAGAPDVATRARGVSNEAASVPAPAVECTGLRYRFGDHVAVDGVDLDVRTGEMFGLLGPNGAGKTTTIRILTTLLPVVEGQARVLGLDVSASPMQARRIIGYVPQQLSADGQLTGRENVSMFARPFDAPRRERPYRVDEVLAAMNLEDSADRLANTYSGGMIRRLELAQALVNRPPVLILHEPTIGLDPRGRPPGWDPPRAPPTPGVTLPPPTP